MLTLSCTKLVEMSPKVWLFYLLTLLCIFDSYMRHFFWKWNQPRFPNAIEVIWSAFKGWHFTNNKLEVAWQIVFHPWLNRIYQNSSSKIFWIAWLECLPSCTKSAWLQCNRWGRKCEIILSCGKSGCKFFVSFQITLWV